MRHAAIAVETILAAIGADIQIDRGTLMTFNEGSKAVNFNGKTVKFTANGSSNTPTAGMSYSSNFKPDPTSYMEISP